jgi:NADPH-dependent curcumin reductase CurA
MTAHCRSAVFEVWRARATMRGFLVRDYADRFEEAGTQVIAWMAEGGCWPDCGGGSPIAPTVELEQ